MTTTEKLAQIAAFLEGEAPLDGAWFGELHPTERGVYWWRKHLREALAAHEAAQAQAVEYPQLAWTADLPPDDKCRYQHCIAETPFGRFLLTWKGWKDGPCPTADETPWGEWFDGGWATIGEAKAACEKEFVRRLLLCRASVQAVPAWQPIATAPKDGTEVLAFNGERALMHWIEGRGYALWAYADVLLSDACPEPEQPTHWMPLPAAPKGD